MGWIAINKNREIIREDEGSQGRPVQAGEEGNLLFIMQEDFGRKVGIDLLNGVIIIDYDDWGFSPDGTVELYNPKTVFHINDETNIITGMFEIVPSEVARDGSYTNEFVPIIWRPIWFTRVTNGIPTKVIGAQTTTPTVFGSKNIKKMISIYDNGVLGID